MEKAPSCGRSTRRTTLAPARTVPTAVGGSLLVAPSAHADTLGSVLGGGSRATGSLLDGTTSSTGGYRGGMRYRVSATTAGATRSATAPK